MKHRTFFNLLMALGLTLALGGGILAAAQAQGAGPQGILNPQGEALGTAFTYQGRLTDSTTGGPIAGPCNLRFTLYQSAAGNDPAGSPQTVPSVALNNGYFTVSLDFGASAFTGEGRYLKIEADCGSGYTALSPRVKLNPAPYALHAVSAGALRGRQVSDSAPAAGDVLAWDGNSWMPTGSGAGNAWSLAGNGGTTPGTNFLGTTDNQALQLHVNGVRALRLEPNATSPNLIGGYSGNSVTAGVYGAAIGGGGMGGEVNQVTNNFGAVGGGYGNTADFYAAIGGGGDNTAGSYAAVGGGYGNTASGLAATIGGGDKNTASGPYATVPGGSEAAATLAGQMAYANGGFSHITGTAQASVFVLRNTSSGSAWTALYLDGTTQHLTIADGRTLTFDILVVGRSNAGESAGYYIWGVAENAGGTVTVWVQSVIPLHEDDGNWDAQAVADVTFDALAIQVKGNGETIRWVATVRTAEVAW